MPNALQYLRFWCLLLVLLFVLSSCLNSSDRENFHDHEDYSADIADIDIFRYCEFADKRFDGRWWSLYARGLCSLYHRELEAAEKDFRKALSQKAGDQLNAEMFGYSYINYFPYRELGVVLFKQGKKDKLKDSENMLEKSLEKIKTARAEYYLEEVRKEMILQEMIADETAPVISVAQPKKTQILSNSFNVVVSGTGKDDTYIKSLIINGNDFPVDVPKKVVSFKTNVPIKPGKNIIDIVATDLSNKETISSIVVIGDFTSPSISIDQVDFLNNDILLVRGNVYDDFNLSEITLNDEPIDLPKNGDKLLIRKKVVKEDKYILKVKDMAGNINAIDVIKAYESSIKMNSKLFASLDSDLLSCNGYKNSIPIRNIAIYPPESEAGNFIRLSSARSRENDREIELATYCKKIVVKYGADNPLPDNYLVSINGHVISEGKGDNFIAHAVKLPLDRNEITIKVKNIENSESDSETITIYRSKLKKDILKVCCKIDRIEEIDKVSSDSNNLARALNAKLKNILSKYNNETRFEVYDECDGANIDWKFKINIVKLSKSIEMIINIVDKNGVNIAPKGNPMDDTMTYQVRWGDGGSNGSENYNTKILESPPQYPEDYMDKNKIHNIFKRHLPEAEGIVIDEKEKKFYAEFSETINVSNKYIPIDTNLIGMNVNVFKRIGEKANLIGFDRKKIAKGKIDDKFGLKNIFSFSVTENNDRIEHKDIAVTR